MANTPEVIALSRKLFATFTLFSVLLGVLLSPADSNASELPLFTEVKVDSYSACALTSGGSVSCWGNLVDSPMPNAFKPAKSLALVQDNFACVITSADALKCWWAKADYSWSNGGSHAVPEVVYHIPKNLGPIKQLASSGPNSMCALRLDESVACWGGFWDVDAIKVPNDLGRIEKVSSIGTGYCALNSDSKLTCWGVSFAGSEHECGIYSNGVIQCMDEKIEVTFSSTNDLVEDFYTGPSNICIMRKIALDGRYIFCLGSNHNAINNIPLELATMSDLRKLRVGNNIACAINTFGAVECWGEDYFGAKNVPSIPGGFRDIGLGSQATCAVEAQGKVLCWGEKGRLPRIKFGPPVRNPAPTLIGNGDIGTTGIDFSWRNNATGIQVLAYQLEMRQGSGVWKSRKIVGRAGSTQTLTGLKPNTTYELRLRSKNYAGYSSFSQTYRVKTASKCPALITAKRSSIEHQIRVTESALKSSRENVLAARAERFRAQQWLKNFTDYSKIPELRALIALRDEYEKQFIEALNRGNVSLAAKKSTEMEELGQTIASLLGPYPSAKRQLEDAYEYEVAAGERMKAVADKLESLGDRLKLQVSKCQQ